MSSEPNNGEHSVRPKRVSTKNLNRLSFAGAALTLGGIALFSYFVYSVGLDEIIANIRQFGIAGFAIILGLYAVRILIRAYAWSLSVYDPYELSVRDTAPAVVIGEAMSSMIPLGILISGTSKAIAVRNRVPLVVGFSSIATENLFYSFTTSVFLILGAFTFVRSFDLEAGTALTIDLMIVFLFVAVLFLFLMILRQWHFASETCEWLYQKGILKSILERGRLQVRLFENFVYGFYRRHPGRFLPILLLEAAFHLLGVFEVWFVLSRITEMGSSVLNAFMLESVSRLITIVFKLVPFLIGVDEAGAEFIVKTAAMGVGVGVSLAIIRKGRILFWAMVGLILIITRGLSLRKILRAVND